MSRQEPQSRKNRLLEKGGSRSWNNLVGNHSERGADKLGSEREGCKVACSDRLAPRLPEARAKEIYRHKKDQGGEAENQESGWKKHVRTKV